MTRTALATLLLIGCSGSPPPEPTASAETRSVTVYSGGDIVTMDAARPSAEAVAVQDGRILAVGTAAEVARAAEGATVTAVDLAGQTLVPGFIDGHSHFFQAAMITDYANVSAKPVGQAEDIRGVIAVLKAHLADHPLAPGDWLVGYGYDATALKDGREMTRADLKELGDIPVALIHVSGHGCVLNDAAFALTGITADTPTPENGKIVRDPDGTPSGLLMETAWFGLVMPKMPKPSGAELLDRLKDAQNTYAENGYTTVQDAPMEGDSRSLYEQAAREGRLFLDLIAYADQSAFLTMADQGFDFRAPYQGHLRIAGVKVIMDGSPQGMTAAFTQPYGVPDERGQETRGTLITSADALTTIMKRAYAVHAQVLAHANGDAAIDAVLSAHQAAGAPEGVRTTVIHSQFVREDQLDLYARYGFGVSFFTNHAFFWGDLYPTLLDPARAAYLSPMKAGVQRGLHMTNHSDFLVTPLDPMRILSTSVNRTTRAGVTLGPDQRLSPAEGLKALTLDGAWQYSEEAEKGSIEAGKVADLVILSRNPLTVAPEEIEGIHVVKTIKGGEVVYQRVGG